MSLHGMKWGWDMRGSSPLARLVAIYLGDVYHDPEYGLNEAETSRLLAWVDCSPDDLWLALQELETKGLVWKDAGNGYLEFSIPVEPERSQGGTGKYDPPLSIYVFSSGAATKVGISGAPESRLLSLQSANPNERMLMHFQHRGPASVIRKVERTVHERLRPDVIGNEWFRVTSAQAIDAVRAALQEAGLLAL